MIELFKKAMFTGIGIAALTKDKVDELVQDFIEQGKLSQQEGEKLIDEIMKKSKDSQEELNRWVESMVQDQLTKMNIARTADVESVRAEIAELRERLHRLEQKDVMRSATMTSPQSPGGEEALKDVLKKGPGSSSGADS